VLFYHLTFKFVIGQAEQSIQGLLLSHKGLHEYLQKNTHPALYRLKKLGEIKNDFYSPELLSSTYMVRNVHRYYNKERIKAGLSEIYYKMAAINPRNPLNKASVREQHLIEMFNKNRNTNQYRDIIEIDGKKYLYYALPFLENNQKCLKCHGDRQAAPVQLQAIYKGEGGFGEKTGDIRAIESIQIPLEREFKIAHLISIMMLLGLGSMLLILFISGRLKTTIKLRTEDLEKEIKERKLAEEALRQSERELSIKNRIANILLTIPQDEMYGKVLEVVLEAMQSVFGIFGYIDKHGSFVCPSMTRDIWDQCQVPDKEIIFPRKQWGGLWSRAMVDKKTLYFNKPFNVPKGHLPITRVLDVPIIHQDELIGNFIVGNKETDYNENDKHLLENISDYIAPVLNARLQKDREAEKSKKLEAQLQQAQKLEAIGTLAGGVAHDFNNILSIIIGYAEIALMDVIKDEPLRLKIEGIKTAGEKAVSLTRQLLAFSRKQVIKPEVLNLNKVIKEMEKMLKRMIGENIEFQTILKPELWKVHMDSGQVDQIVINMAVNARDAMPDGGKLIVETANVNLDENYFSKHGIEKDQPGSYVMIAVSDTGIGMDKETREHIFEPFYTTKGVGKGTGLGLSTVYGIAKQNNGFVWVYSEPGQGTTFKVYIPKVKGDVKSEKNERLPVVDLNGSETVLIVEDDDSLRKLVRTALKQRGYKVLKAENGEDALRVSEAHDGLIDLLLTDVVMPKMSGKETAERMQPLYPQMKVIYMSGYTDDSIVQHGVLAPGLNFLEKPFTPESLAQKLREVLDKKQD